MSLTKNLKKRGKGRRDPIYEEQRDFWIKEIKKAARKEKKDFDPDNKAYGEMVLRNIKAISGLPIEGLKELLIDITDRRKGRAKKMQAAFQIDKL